MTAYRLRTRNITSTWFSLTFALLLIFYFIFIEFFQDSKVNRKNLDILESPIKTDFLERLTQLNFKNRLGEYKIIKKELNWFIQEPQSFPAKEKTILSIINALENINIHTIHQNEPINFKSFSLNKPIVEMDLIAQDKSINLKIGIINPIDNTSFITVSDHEYIYQTDLFKFQFEKLEFSDFIDANVFSTNLAAMRKFTIYQGNSTQPLHVLESINEAWVSNRYNTISNTNTENKIKAILDINTHMIVDQTNEEIDNFLQNYLSNPLYRIVIDLKNGETITYKITPLVKAIQELKVEKKQYFIMSASDRPYPYLIDKAFIDIFQIRYSDLKP